MPVALKLFHLQGLLKEGITENLFLMSVPDFAETRGQICTVA